MVATVACRILCSQRTNSDLGSIFQIRHFNRLLIAKMLSQSSSYVKNPFNTTTPLIRTIFHDPKVVYYRGSTVYF